MSDEGRSPRRPLCCVLKPEVVDEICELQGRSRQVWTTLVTYRAVSRQMSGILPRLSGVVCSVTNCSAV